jgi:hypothetical protein
MDNAKYLYYWLVVGLVSGGRAFVQSFVHNGALF